MRGLPDRFDKKWRDICEVAPISAAHARYMIGLHYLGKWPAIVRCSLGLYVGPFVNGLCMFSDAPHQTSVRYNGVTWELARLWVHDDIPTNAESWFIGKAVKYVKIHYPEVRYLVSYADPSAGHMGTIYKAANWQSDGRTDDDRKTPRFDLASANTGKKYGRSIHVPADEPTVRVRRVSKYRFVYPIR